MNKSKKVFRGWVALTATVGLLLGGAAGVSASTVEQSSRISAASFTTNTPAVKGAIGERWNYLQQMQDYGIERNPVGYPITGERGGIKNGGVWQQFQNGHIHWSPRSGAWETHGAIRDGWAQIGWENSKLGYPVAAEYETGSSYTGKGALQNFQGGIMVWSPATGGKSLTGAIKDKWESMGSYYSDLGYPTTHEFSGGAQGAGQHFQKGSIYWSSRTGAKVVKGAIRDSWARQGWERGRLGYPTSEEQWYYDSKTYKSGRIQYFQGGSIVWLP